MDGRRGREEEGRRGEGERAGHGRPAVVGQQLGEARKAVAVIWGQERHGESTCEEGWRAGSKGLHMNRWTEHEAQERSPGWFREVDRGVVVQAGHCPITTELS